MLKHQPQEQADSLLEQVHHFLAAHPHLESIDLMLSDMNGVIRGKRIEAASLEKIAKEGMCLPASVFALDICGETVEETGLGFEQGDGDRICHILPHSLSVIPWKKNAAQALVTMHEVDGQPFFADPRQLLTKTLSRLQQRGMFPCVAIEWEFYLLDARSENRQPQAPLLPKSQQRMQQTQVYSLDELDEFSEFIRDIQEYCHTQNIPSDNVIAEYAPGQFEVTLQHQEDPLLACDQAILLKRAIKAVAKQHGYLATFMAKPYAEHSGNGCHVHISMLDELGNNRFAKDSALLEHALAGLLDTMPQAIALLAPNANSYRRFQPDMFVPLQANWGWDNRTVALRIPSGSKANTRIEHRVAGADCNPYIVMSALLAGIDYGIEQQLDCAEAISGDASKANAPALPTYWQQALKTFSHSTLWSLLGEDFSHVYHANKLSEWHRFEAQVSPLEQQWYQQMV
ncbi:glutamine synthetase [Agarivorans sp. Toyoura001]|uniref:glutamine synthetase family protein n=1 Tax=Agarivorans sp. Toyoura001 TaxID=2283141 RepID=UPI0010CFD0BA|nr:glutamine synthetase family protein [Agarivorans sp. Toyoura001]GDY25193.1 glutamine synthetase [Agarivorans sp. Toyoura001]